jgi:uroporphyrinogen decarboxylase
MSLSPLTLDLDGFRRNILRQGTPQRVFFFEHAEAQNIKKAIVERFDLAAHISDPPDSLTFACQQDIALQRFLGHEVFRVFLPGGKFETKGIYHAESGRSWENEHSGMISSWADVEAFPWPRLSDIDFAQLEWFERNLPEDMGLDHTVSIWEIVRKLFGFETFCLKLYDDPTLIDEVIRRVGEYYLGFAQALCDFRCLFAVYGSDDMGYKTATMMAPSVLKEKILPWHKRIAAHVHAQGKLYFLHACGNLREIMDTLIDDVGIDAKNSFEDTIEPVTEAKRRWGHRVGLLGGIDVDLVARADERAIRQRVRETLEVCVPGGGYCLGMGNWVTSYIPLDSYLTVLDEGRRFAANG